MRKHINAVYSLSGKKEVMTRQNEKDVINDIEKSESFLNFVDENKKSEDNLWKLKTESDEPFIGK